MHTLLVNIVPIRIRYLTFSTTKLINSNRPDSQSVRIISSNHIQLYLSSAKKNNINFSV